MGEVRPDDTVEVVYRAYVRADQEEQVLKALDFARRKATGEYCLCGCNGSKYPS
jgi:hypothetical protein